MVVAQFTAVGLQKDDRAFVKYNESSRVYEGISVSKVTGAALLVVLHPQMPLKSIT